MKTSFYGPLRSRAYDIGTDVSSHMVFYLEQWKRLGRPQPMIELMCGTGLNMIWYLQEGADCDGLDASRHMLEQGRKRLDSHGYQSTLIEQNVQDLMLEKTYPYICVPNRSLGHIYDNAIATEVLRRIYKHLPVGGWLVFDVTLQPFLKNYPKNGAVFHELTEDTQGGTVFTTSFWQHLEEGRVIRCFNKKEHFVDDTLIETELFDYHERMYQVDELERMLRTAGFRDIQSSKAYQHNTPPDVDDEMVVYTCRKV